MVGSKGSMGLYRRTDYYYRGLKTVSELVRYYCYYYYSMYNIGCVKLQLYKIMKINVLQNDRSP